MVSLQAQSNPDSTADTTRTIDTLVQKTGGVLKKDTSIAPVQAPPVYQGEMSWKPVLAVSHWEWNMSDYPVMDIWKKLPYFQLVEHPAVVPSNLYIARGKETLFYVVVAIVFVFALLKISFAKYFNDLFRVFFRTTLKQRQIREQLMQTPFPSLMYNGFFVASAGLYIDLLLFHYFEYRPVDNFWMLYLYCCIALAVIYFVKFIGLKICGWLFNMKQAADSYIFIVFIINKVIGIFLVPFLVILAFTQDPLYSTALVISWAGIGALLLYRFILGFGAVRNEVRFNLFHFFLYLLAFEAAPLLLIYKVLLLVF